jgi:hypothetical protein
MHAAVWLYVGFPGIRKDDLRATQMGARRACIVVSRLVAPFVLVFACLSGCQTAGPSRTQLVEYRGQISDLGLADPVSVEALKINASLPNGWEALSAQKSALYTHQQWRSASHRTAVGITYIRMPLPFSARILAGLASNEVGKKTTGRVHRRWTDELGREWFEAENDRYHLTGYVMTRGLDAWINYCGYRVKEPMHEAEVDLGGRALASILPAAIAPRNPVRTASAE